MILSCTSSGLETIMHQTYQNYHFTHGGILSCIHQALEEESSEHEEEKKEKKKKEGSDLIQIETSILRYPRLITT